MLCAHYYAKLLKHVLTDFECLALERNPRPPRKDSKGNSAKGKEKETIFDANESSLHDEALRTKLLMGYEAFKVS